ncbi:MAG: 2OG-Fe(II) oxygenase [Hyphomicrobium sp.]
MAITSDAVVSSMISSIDASKRTDQPYSHWFLTECLPQPAADTVLALPFPAPELGGLSGKREVHNATRKYFDTENMAAFPVCKAVNDAFQDPRLARKIESFFGTKLGGSYLRVEFAQDTDGFWLEPHTDLGVKLFTMLLYLSTDASHADLGTDIYDQEKKHIGRSPFQSNAAMVFVPSNITYHGFEPRSIAGVRKSVIINYVTNDWRAREQLAFPDRPIEH